MFPNSTSSDGVPWRERFNAEGHLQFLEFYFDGELDFVGVIDQITVDEASVTVHCDDAWWLLKKAYVRDWTVTQAPRDVIERGTKVWVSVAADNFPPGSLSSQWNSSIITGGGTVAIGPSGGLLLTATPRNTAGVQAETGVTVPALGTATGTWAATATVQWADLPDAASLVALNVSETVSGGGDLYEINLHNGNAQFSTTALGVVAQQVVTS
ncbi:MAG TPA: hypothetical protein VKO16_04020, partial [Polyangia bacterium]|nr:hypothetical protein [Polyangia bacterium]